MLISEVIKLTPQQRFLYWIKERLAIYKKKEAKEGKPWTDDEILQNHKFCNVLRINDRVSQWLLNNWYTPYKDHPNMALAVTLARQLNNTDSLEAVGFPDKWEPEQVQQVLDDRALAGLANYSSAYIVTGNYDSKDRDRELKPHQTVWRVCQQVVIDPPFIDTASMFRTWRGMLGMRGFGAFIAGQVVADLRWGMSGTWADKCSWAPMGPGSHRGINRYLGRPIKGPEAAMTQDEFIELIRELYGKLRKYLPRTMELIDFQGCFCEFDKYERTLLGEGKPRQRYNGISDEAAEDMARRRTRMNRIASATHCGVVRAGNLEITYDTRVSNPGQMTELTAHLNDHWKLKPGSVFMVEYKDVNGRADADVHGQVPRDTAGEADALQAEDEDHEHEG